jgi:N-acetyl sugar amidotransferase
MYPMNAKPTIIIDDEDGICSGCKYHQSRSSQEVDWKERQIKFEKILDEAKKEAKIRGNNYDCIIPVSGGKDSTYQVYIVKEIYGLNPLLVSYNHVYNQESGLRNLENLIEKSGCDLIRFTSNPKSVKKLSRFMLQTVGDLTWHYHAGIKTLPFKVAVEKNIPLIIWGEHGFAELTGIVSLEDMVEFTRWTRKEHDMRGFEPKDVVEKSKGLITMGDLDAFIFPTDDELEKTGLKGIYMSNFFDWDAKTAAEEVMKKWDFKPITYERQRTFVQYAKIDDHANDIHDYLKFLKFGYGRATDDASIEIRHGRLSREEGIKLVERYDSKRPKSLEKYLEFLEIKEEDFFKLIDPMRDLSIWRKNGDDWTLKDSISNHIKNKFTEKARVAQKNDRVFDKSNQNLYYNPDNPPQKSGDSRMDEMNTNFKIL